jgi:ribosomal protein L21E
MGIRKKKRCTEPGVAKIVDIKRSEDTDDKGNKSYKYRPVLEFNVGTQTIRKAAGVSSNKSKAYRVGDMVNIKFNPLKPKEFMTKKQKTGAFTGGVIMGVAVVIAVVTLIFV